MYRFRKILERPDWNPPVAVTLEITYEATPVEVTDDSESSGGVTECDWLVVGAKGTIGHYHQPEIFHLAENLLAGEPGLRDEIVGYCYEDYAMRTFEDEEN